MGETYEQEPKEAERVPFRVINDEWLSACAHRRTHIYTPQEISAMILQKMKKTAEDYLGTGG
jgi:molecular chaperone DnaK